MTKKRWIALFTTVALLVPLLLVSVYLAYNRLEEAYQRDADILRLKHLRYYSGLLEEFHARTGRYPFQGRETVPVYVHIAQESQRKHTRPGPPYEHKVFSPKAWFNELENGLGRPIEEYYDPQLVSTGRPNFYIYMITDDVFFFAVHVHNSFPFSKHIASHYNKIEVSNAPDEENRVILPADLLQSEAFQTALAAPVRKAGFLAAR